MKLNTWKTSFVSLGLAGAFLLGAGLSSSATVSAQGWRRDRDEREHRDRDRYDNRRDRDWDDRVDRNHNGVNDRYERDRAYRIDRNRNGVDDRYENNRYGYDPYYRRNDGYYDNYGYGTNNSEYQKGYRDGLDRGRQDAQTNRAMDPNNSSHYRNGNSSYRAGFERGFYQSFRQYSGRRW